jgi:excisionase family DNA binding protein
VLVGLAIMNDEKQKDQPESSFSTMLPTGDVARIFNVDTATIRRWSDSGVLKSYRIGPRGERRFRREDIAVLYLNKAIQRYLID